MKKWLLLLIATGLVVTGWQWAVSRRWHQPESAVPGHLLAMAEKRDIAATLDVTGEVAPDSLLDVRAEVSGKVKTLAVQAGDVVQPGDLLVEIDDRDLQTERKSALTEIEGARLSAEKIQRNYKRAQELFASNLVSREVFDNISADYRLAQNVLEKAQARLQTVEDKIFKTRIFAPTGGTVLEVSVVEGQVVTGAGTVNAGTSIMKIADVSKMLVNATVNQVDVMQVATGRKVTISSDSVPGLRLDAQITFVAPIATIRNGVKGFAIKAAILQPDARIRPGMTVTITIPCASAHDVVSVPISAVFKGQGEERVVYVRSGEKTERRQVEVGVTNYDHAEIKSGVRAGEQVFIVDPDTLGKRS